MKHHPPSVWLDRDEVDARDLDTVVMRYQRHVSRGQARLAKLLGLPAEVRADGCYIYDQDGVQYLDCGGHGVFTLGHRHPAVVAAVARQLNRQPLSSKLFLNPVLAEAAERLIDVAPPALQRVTFTNSGAESVELALKLGRASGRHRVVAMQGGFHGKTIGALSVTGHDRYRAPFQPLLPYVDRVPFADAGALADALASGPPALVILEPVQAEGGVRIPPPDYLGDVRTICDRFDALLVMDEIQSGLGRLGAWWGCSMANITPDVLLTGKALGGGVMPVAAAVSTVAAYGRLDFEPLLHSSTFAGNPLAAAAAMATLAVMRAENVPQRVSELGAVLLASLRDALADADEVIRDVRGAGLMVGIEFRSEHHGARFLEEMLNRRIIVCYSLNSDRVVRLTPSYLLAGNDVDLLCSAAAEAVRVLMK
jgi:putrescine aminotransferase